MTRDCGDTTLFEVHGTAAPAPRDPAGAEKTFRHYDPHQAFLLPPSLDDWLPEDHTARFVAEAVEELLDLSEIYASYSSAPKKVPLTWCAPGDSNPQPAD